ncbi:uncharacterized protein LOC141619106 [Silene latifolia]|uniref:uncharacterized protein LOC141619106 n=1 Tax=Silene latifolia TaxID=37657 RepID=UPI003D775356
MLASQFNKTDDGQLYKRSVHGVLLRCIDKPTADKWVEAKSYRELKAKQVAKFIQNEIICRYGLPHEFINEHKTHCHAETETTLQKYKIKHHKSSPYRIQTNGAVEAANKTVTVILKNMSDKYREWPDRIPFPLWGY